MTRARGWIGCKYVVCVVGEGGVGVGSVVRERRSTIYLEKKVRVNRRSSRIDSPKITYLPRTFDFSINTTSPVTIGTRTL